MVQLGEHFRSDTQRRHSDIERQKWFIKARDERERQQKLEDKFEDSMNAVFSTVLAATEEALLKFEQRLNSYDQATVIALMENQEQLDAVNERLDNLLSQAYVMEDGRRVFKSEDGSYVIDEFGKTVDGTELDAMLIPDSNPTAEVYASELSLKEELTQQRQDILEFQEKVDAARENTAEGDISEQELDELDAELLEAMPASVRAHVPGLEAPKDAIDLKADFQPSANPMSSMPARTITFDQNVPG
jgi:histidinol dehydrogenase